MARKKKEVTYKNSFINKPLIIIVIAIFMLIVALGVLGIVQGKIFNQSQTSYLLIILLVIFAISFIIGSVFFENKGVNKLHSLIGGCAIALIIVFSIITFISGIAYIFNGAICNIGPELLISAFAICMIISMISFNVITRNR